MIYLDNSATTRVSSKALQAVISALEVDYGNPSSPHGLGSKAGSMLSETRRILASAMDCAADEVFFTSGGTEANNLCIKGAALARRRFGQHIITSKIEHASVLESCRFLEDLGFTVTYLDVDQNGLVDLDQLKDVLTEGTTLISIMWVNNETGVIQPLEDICKILEQVEPGPLLHVDGVQALGKIRLNELGPAIDLLSISGHKIHAPKGVGAAKIRKGLNLIPLLHGGGQEAKLRSGTENVPSIHAFGVAAVEALGDLEENNQRILRMRNRLVDHLQEIPRCRINTPLELSVPHILNVSFVGIPGEMLIHHLEAKGLYISTGAACSSRKAEGSHVLRALGMKDDVITGSCRISLSRYNTENEMDKAAQIIADTVKELSYFV
ncbi:MAG: cysteine desulfurase family protein [Limnochordia bacterium]|nr:cysteine desulfurase [Limnochordia bacterium]MDD2630232.1 cysteine desulfurase family protein [Limnochordia bacterium]MDD4517182.1 cysteine desulfurase family protein [Limnochordia bacterium]